MSVLLGREPVERCQIHVALVAHDLPGARVVERLDVLAVLDDALLVEALELDVAEMPVDVHRGLGRHERDQLVLDQLVPDLLGAVSYRVRLLLDLGAQRDQTWIGGMRRGLELDELSVQLGHLSDVLVADVRDLLVRLQRHHDRLAGELQAFDDHERALARLDHARAAEQRHQVESDLHQ